MYESFFRFQNRPFAAAPLTADYYPGEGIEHARQTLIRLIERAEGPGLVVGPAGVGKSLLCRLLAEYFRDQFDVAMLSSTRIGTRKTLLQNILFELGLPYRGLEEGELRLSLLDFLQPGNSTENGLLLIVDEAHTLPLRLLDEIRMITNLVRDGQVRVRLVLAGGPKLEERFAHPKLESFNQRLAARCYLEPLSRDDTHRYVRAQLAAAGAETEIFDESARESVYRATDGIPRLINQVCDHALVLSCAAGCRQLGASDVEEAWSDLQQLPGPWNDGQTTLDEQDNIVEFSSWDDDESSSPSPRTSEGRQASPTSPEAAPGDAEHNHDPVGAVGDQPAPEPEHDAGSGESATAESSSEDRPGSACQEFDETLTDSELFQYTTGCCASEQDAEGLSEEYATVGAAEIELLENCLETASEPDQDEETPYQGPEQDTPPAEPVVRDPFGSFADEEVVVDHTTARVIEAFRGRPVVTSELGREIARTLSADGVMDTHELPADPAPLRNPETAPEVQSGVVEVPDVVPQAMTEPADIWDQRPEVADAVVAQIPLSDSADELLAAVNVIAAISDPDPHQQNFEAGASEPQSTQKASPPRDEVFAATPVDAGGKGSRDDPMTFPISDQFESDDRDLIFLENTPPTAEDLDVQSVPRNLEYRELFAQLRKS